ncbi:MAG: hypothetical protein D8M59_16605 [Planctomycetes bacterium]|nr:hypothetical protein [Planctomycetota bacterium]NOG53160.1 hypothetical protein [Planctomycetota bacterium]
MAVEQSPFRFASHSRLLLLILPIAILCNLSVAQEQQTKERKRRRNATEVREHENAVTAEKGASAWVDAMEELNDPTLLFVFGLKDGTVDQQMGLSLTDDETAYCSSLASNIQRLMERAYPDTDVLRLDRKEIIDQSVRDVITANSTNPDLAVFALVDEFDADLTIWARFVPIESGNQRVICELLDRRGRSRAVSDNWSLNPRDFSGSGQVAAEMFVKIAETALNMTRRIALRHTFLLQGIENDRMLHDIAEAVKNKIDGVTGNIRPVFRRAGSESMGKMEIRYAGDFYDLSYDLQDLLLEDFGYNVDSLSSNDGAIVLALTPTQNAPSWKILANPNVADPTGLRGKFSSQYTNKGAPRVAVIVKERVFVNTHSFAVVPGGTNVAPNAGHPDAGDDTKPDDPDAKPAPDPTHPVLPYPVSEQTWEVRSYDAMSTSARELEDAIGGVLNDLNMTVVDGTAVHNALRRQLLVTLDTARPVGNADKPLVVSDAQMQAALSNVDAWDMLVEVNLTTPDAIEAQPPGRQSITARMTDVNFHLLATQRWSPNKGSSSRAHPVDPADTDAVAEFLAGNLALDFYINHLGEAATIPVFLEDVPDYRTVEQIATILTRMVPGVLSVSNSRFDSVRGGGAMQIRYTGSYQDLLNSFLARTQTLQVDVDTERATPNELVLRFSPLRTGG